MLDDESVKCWGDPSFLGIGRTFDPGSAASGYIGDDPGEMGDNLPAVNLGTGRRAKAISAAYFFTCALLDNGQVKCWGSPSITDGSASGYIGDGPSEMGDNLPAVNLGTGRTVKALASATVGTEHMCAILDDDTLKCWGGTGALGLGGGGDRNLPSTMGDNLPVVALGTARKPKAVSCGNAHTCVLLDDDTVKCFGLAPQNGGSSVIGNVPGQMGDALSPLDFGAGRKVQALSAGAGLSCVVLENAQIKCWGFGEFLGAGDKVTRAGAASMGDALPYVDLGF